MKSGFVVADVVDEFVVDVGISLLDGKLEERVSESYGGILKWW